MKTVKPNVYLALAIIGVIIPNIFVIQESIQSGNYMLWARPLETICTAFETPINAAFMSDLLLVVIVFLLWMLPRAKKAKINPVPVVLVTFTLGLASGFPLFLYLESKKK